MTHTIYFILFLSLLFNLYKPFFWLTREIFFIDLFRNLEKNQNQNGNYKIWVNVGLLF